MSEVKKVVQQGLDQWFLRQDVIDQLLQNGDDDLEGINAYADRILMIAQAEEAEHQTLEDPFDRVLLWFFLWSAVKVSMLGTSI